MKILRLLLVAMPFISFSQVSFEQQLDSINTTETAEKFLETNKSNKGQLYVFNKEKHKTRLAEGLFKMPKGGKKLVKSQFKNTYYKVIEKDEVEYCKFQIILFDANTTSEEDAVNNRNKVVQLYNKGYKFADLAKHYSSGKLANTNGDTGWIKPGDMSAAFDEEAFLQPHAIGEVFVINDHEAKKYYLALKTNNKTPIEEITVLKLTERL